GRTRTRRARGRADPCSRFPRPCGLLQTGSASHAITTEHPLSVSQLTGMLHQEARLADELARPLGEDAVDRVAPIVDLDLLLVVLRLLVRSDEPVLEDGVEVG